jgi:hypothetical protein
MDDLDDDKDDEMSKHSDDHQHSLASSSSRPASPAVVVCGLPRCSSPISSLESATAATHHGLGGLHGLYNSQTAPARTPPFSGSEAGNVESRRQHQQHGAVTGGGGISSHPPTSGNNGNNNTSNGAKRSKTSHHVNRWRAETNQL